MKLSDTAERLARRKYYQKDADGNIIEDFDKLCLRVAMAIAGAEKNTVDRNYWAGRYYQLMNELWFLPGGRILANAGSDKNNSLYNCYYLSIEDSRDSIYTVLKKAAEIFAHGGGIGFNFSHIREKGSAVSNGSKASGPVSFLGLFDYSASVISQASRRGAQLACLDIDHPDIFDFIRAKDTEGLLEHFNLSIGITDDFMTALGANQPWKLISRYNGKATKEVDAKEVLHTIAEHAWNTGDPGILYLDAINRDNAVPQLGRIEGTNPCLDKDSLLLDGDCLVKVSGEADTFTSWQTGLKESVKLLTNAGHEIIVTPDHLIMLEDGSFIEAEKTLGKSVYWGLGDRQVSMNGAEESPNNVVRGFLFGDGFICGGGLGITVRLNKEKEHEVYEMLISHNFHEQDCGDLYTNLERFPIDVTFLEHRVYERDLPDDVLFGSSTKVAGFLRGLFEANGSVNRHGQISLKATCIEMVKKVQTLLASFGIPAWICANKPTTVEWKNGEYTSRESYNLQIAPRNAWLFGSSIGFISARKQNKIKRLEGTYNSKLIVTSITPAGVREVWDFNLPKHYSFANGFIVHNCGEQPLRNEEVCDLGSINLVKMLDTANNSIPYFSHEKLAYATTIAIRFLDSVHDVSEAVLPSIGESSALTRKLGLGVMGWADVLAILGLAYDSKEALDLARQISLTMKVVAYETSRLLADERGPYPAFDKDKSANVWFPELGRAEPTRNASLICLAPTGSISILAGVNSSIEPFFSLQYDKLVTEGNGSEVAYKISTLNPYLKILVETGQVQEQDSYSYETLPEGIRDRFKTAHDLSYLAHLNMQAAWQENIEGSISKSINLPHDATVEDVENIIILGWKMGLKGLTVYRDGCKQFQILNKR